MAQVPARQNLTKALISEVAMDIGKEMVAHLEVMYPDVFKVMNSGCRLSIRNHIHNDIMGALECQHEDDYRQWMERRRVFRRKWLKTYRDMRKIKP